jgi:uncharacterized membrane protein
VEVYPFLKLVHILSATLLFGTGLGSAFYMWQAHRSRDIAVIASISRNVVLADWIFTTPAVIIQPVSGVWMMVLLGYGMNLSWLHWSVVLYLLAGACWLPVVWLQIQLRRMSCDAMATGTALPEKYHRYMRYWFFLGWPAFLSVLAAFYLMVVKPVSL